MNLEVSNMMVQFGILQNPRLYGVKPEKGKVVADFSAVPGDAAQTDEANQYLKLM